MRSKSALAVQVLQREVLMASQYIINLLLELPLAEIQHFNMQEER